MTDTTIIVNYAHPLWNSFVADKSSLGLGEPRDFIFGTTTIRMARASLESKRTALQTELSYWQAPGRGGSLDRAERRRTFGRRLYDILYPENIRSNSQKDQYWGSDVSKLGSIDLYENRQEIYRLLNGYITLIGQILDGTPGLVVVPQNESPSPDGTGLTKVASGQKTLTFNFITVETVEIPLGDIIKDAVNQLLTVKTLAFFDKDREYKTVLNFGDDRQYLIESWRQGNTPDTIQLKLTSELDQFIDVQDDAYIVREIASSVVDTVEIEPLPLVDTSLQLRPYNSNVKRTDTTQVSVNNFTLNSISGNDTVYQQWYTDDFNSSELNIDFTDYNNFVMFGSATMRLAAFRNKLLEIADTTNTSSIDSIIRQFDPYEQFLYHATEVVPYSASAYYADSGTEYNSPAFWPKSSSGAIYNVTSSQSNNWYATQSAIAQRFDDFNPNYLVKHLPTHIQEDAESQDFSIFVSMVGHVMDNLKVYIDQFPNIYSTSPDPLDDLTMDQVYEVATSFGFSLPNAYAMEELQNFVSTVYNTDGGNTLLKETWKRFLHSAIYLSKAKGTKTAVDGVMNVYGINSPLVQLKENSYPTTDNFVRSDELSYALRFTDPSGSIRIPLVSASINTDTVQVRFLPQDRQTRTILNTDTSWAIDIVPHPSASREKYGRLHVLSGSGRILVATSSYFPLFGEDYTHIMLRSQSQDLSIIQTDGDQLLFREIISSSITSTLWNGASFVYVGGSGSMQIQTFKGVVDEVHTWNEQISNELFIKQAYDPGSYYGSNYSSSYNNLYVHLAFSQPLANITSSAVNETPWSGTSTVELPTIGFTTGSYQKVLRGIKQFVPVVGASAYSNNKVFVAPPPVFPSAFLESGSVPVLKSRSSIKPIDEKKYIGGQDIVSFAVSPIDFVNQNIMRTMGTVNTNYLIGSPRKIRDERYTEVDELYKFYIEKYNISISPNEYIRFFKNSIYGPSEQVASMIPARSALVTGVVIESNILDRKRNNTLRAFRVDGSGTNTFLKLVNSASNAETNLLAGAYSFDANYKLYPDKDTVTIPVEQRMLQVVNSSDTTPVTSSVNSDNSGIAFVESTIPPVLSLVDSEYAYHEGTVEYEVPIVPQFGYPRAPFVGVPASGSYPSLLDGEDNTTIPFYDIPPRSDFNDIRATTYFHKKNGVYRLPSIISKYKTEIYLAKFLENRASPLDQVYSPIILLPPDTVPAVPGRDSIRLREKRYEPAQPNSGIIKLANTFSLLGVIGEIGLKVSLYRATDNALLFEATLDGDSDINPYLLMQTTDGILNYTITNTTASPIVSALEFSYFAYEPLSLIPEGYLPQHYRFSRSTSVPALRRSYLGCRQVYCDGKCPPGVEPTETTKPFDVELVNQDNENTVNNPTGASTGRRFGGAGPLVE